MGKMVRPFWNMKIVHWSIKKENRGCDFFFYIYILDFPFKWQILCFIPFKVECCSGLVQGQKVHTTTDYVESGGLFGALLKIPRGAPTTHSCIRHDQKKCLIINLLKLKFHVISIQQFHLSHAEFMIVTYLCGSK